MGDLPLARFGLRAGAWVVDAIPLALVPFVVANLTGSAIMGFAAFLATGVAWCIVPEARVGMTVGKRLFGVRTVDRGGAAQIGLGRSTLRWVVKYLVCGVLPVGYLWYFRGGACRAWQDLAAGTVVRDLVSPG